MLRNIRLELVPVHPELLTILDAWSSREGPILPTAFGQAFSAKGMSNFMAERIGQAGLPERCVTHGLRKAAARRLAEAGCSANEIAAITGHVSLEEVARYTRAALAEAAGALCHGPTGTRSIRDQIPKPSPAWGE
jgi:integrase